MSSWLGAWKEPRGKGPVTFRLRQPVSLSDPRSGEGRDRPLAEAGAQLPDRRFSRSSYRTPQKGLEAYADFEHFGTLAGRQCRRAVSERARDDYVR